MVWIRLLTEDSGWEASGSRATQVFRNSTYLSWEYNSRDLASSRFLWKRRLLQPQSIILWDSLDSQRILVHHLPGTPGRLAFIVSTHLQPHNPLWAPPALCCVLENPTLHKSGPGLILGLSHGHPLWCWREDISWWRDLGEGSSSSIIRWKKIGGEGAIAQCLKTVIWFFFSGFLIV